uniref:Recombinase domain-containing protein n=1 Tax=Heterorhabditis bacteriophora TaxID=37862 RepID=A0A1I7W7I5_HETBA
MEPQRVRIGTLLIGQRALELNFRSLSASLIEIYRCRSLKDKNRQGNYGVVPTVHVLNSAFIDNPKNARRVHYCQPKSAARLLICREVIAEYNIFRRKTSCETTGHIRRNIMASISKPDYVEFFKKLFLGKLIKPLRGQAPLIPHDVKLITDFEIQAIDAIKSTLGVEVLGYEIK